MRFLLAALLLTAGLTELPAQAAGEDYLCISQENLRIARARWQPAEFPLKFYILPPPDDLKVPATVHYKEVVQRALENWQRSAPEVARYRIVAFPHQADITVEWINYFPDTETWGLTQSGNYRRLNHVTLAVRAQPGTAFAATGEVLFSEDELLALATHEIGHSFGLGHSNSPDDIMSPSLFRLTVAYGWSITARDAQTLKRLYAFPANSKVICP